MKAVVFQGPFKLAVEDVDDPKIEQPGDAVIRITTANICGSDLHPYEGRSAAGGGHGARSTRTWGIVEEVGPGVRPGQGRDEGVGAVPTWPCGTCRNCTDGWTSACLRANPSGQPGTGYGYPQMGPYRGGQAEYLRVPWADFNPARGSPPGTEHEGDFTLLSDIFPTGYHGTELVGVEPGRTVAIFEAGPVGLAMAALSAGIRGAAQTFVVDFQPDRLALAGEDGSYAGQPGSKRGRGPRRSSWTPLTGSALTAASRRVGYQAHDSGRAGAPGTGARRAGPGGPGDRQDRRGRGLRAVRRGRRD